MEVQTYGCGSCALGEIKMLSHPSSSAEEAMALFCSMQLGNATTRYGPQESSRKYALLIPIYVFVAGPEVKSGQPGSSHHSKDHWPTYGTDFAAFIVEKGLGGVATLPPRLNEKYHPNTTCQAWLWTPDQKAMEAWYDKHQGAKLVAAEKGKEPKIAIKNFRG